MNKKLIITYFQEFNHWLHGGKLLIRNNDEDIWINMTEVHWDMNSKTVSIIINDEFYELRKALCDDKIIQIWEVTSQHVSDSSKDIYGWKDFKSFKPDSKFGGNVHNYRIKSDRPKFKVGDFVRYVHSTPAKALEIDNINGNRYYFTNSEISCLKHELEPWSPIKNEWCWFYDNKSSKFAVVGQFKETCNDEFISTTGTKWRFCEPFLNSLPSYLKDN